jgi:hypothetical protein
VNLEVTNVIKEQEEGRAYEGNYSLLDFKGYTIFVKNEEETCVFLALTLSRFSIQNYT